MSKTNRKRGAQPGHPPQGGAPYGNINAVITGAYMKIYGVLLSDEEKEIVDEVVGQGVQRRGSLLHLLATFRIRERRLMQDINEIRGGNAELLTRRTHSLVEPSGKKAEDGREVLKLVKINKEEEPRRELLQRFEDALTRIQTEIRRTEDSIRQYDIGWQKLELERQKATGEYNINPDIP
ncbi:MAG: hypothetical protein FWH05_08645 [Oscillospiraceae bacterium]|nr:hypothetical protein [Oscillospiraceae bacterium]